MIEIGQVINEKFVDNIEQEVLEHGYTDTGSWCDKYFCEHYSADGDEEESFYNSMQAITDWHSHVWKRDWEYEHVQSQVKSFIKSRLEDEGFWKFPYKFGGKIIHPKLDVDTTQCGFHFEIEPTIISSLNKDDVQQCLWDAAHDIGWAISESWQLFLQTTNPCCWDGKPPRERYGKGWIRDDQTRVLYMQHKDQISERMFNRLLYRRHTLSYSSGWLTEYDRNGDEYHG